MSSIAKKSLTAQEQLEMDIMAETELARLKRQVTPRNKIFKRL